MRFDVVKSVGLIVESEALDSAIGLGVAFDVDLKNVSDFRAVAKRCQ